MESSLVRLICFFVMLAVIRGMHVKSKPGEFEDTYGDSVDTPAEEVQNDDFEDYGSDPEPNQEEETEIKNNLTAELRSKSQVFPANIGDLIRLPCEVTNPEAGVIVWRKDDSQVLYQDGFVNGFPNIKFSNEGLEVNITSQKDAGEYSCQIIISENNKPKITHKILLPGPPKIVRINVGNNQKVYQVGETLELSCVVEAHPKPKISWHFGSHRIEPSGENITITDLKPHNSGVYRCFADNNIVPPAHEHIQINVEHKPIVTIDKYMVNSNNEKDAELKCTVHAYPPAIVVWQKDHNNIKSIPSKINLQRHENMNNVDYILMITNVTEKDFGQYTCSASNQLGKVEKSVSLVKVPVIQGSFEQQKVSKDVVLSWKVESKSPITKHQLEFRKKGESDWKNVIPEVRNDGSDVHPVQHTFKGLEPGSYETRARSQNSHGWSEYSEIMSFEAVPAKNGPNHKHHKKHHKDQVMKDKQASHTTQHTPALRQEVESTVIAPVSGCAPATASLYLTSIALLTLCFRQ